MKITVDAPFSKYFSIKKIICISCMFLFLIGLCSYDPPRGALFVHNNSIDTVYVYYNYGKADSLPRVSSLYVLSSIMPDKYDVCAICGTPKKPNLCGIDMTLFFITKGTIDNYDLDEIYNNQMYVKKMTLTEEYLKKNNWKYTYSP